MNALKIDDPEQLMRDWVEALESGEYTQGHHTMRAIDKNGFVTHCCMGVLADLCGVPANLAENCSYPSNVPGVDREFARLMYRKTQDTLADMNDLLKLTFSEIAAVIRQANPQVFEGEDDE